MTKLAWKPWHEVVKIRDDLKSGELSLSIFAADLYEVIMGRAKPVYQDTKEFFSLTYPTFNLRELAKDVAARLAGKNDKAVRQLELTYGGGKTHSLITLLHLVQDPAKLPDLPAVQEFKNHIGIPIPKSRIAVLPFDKLDIEKGMEIRGPKGEARWLKHPWSILAFQIAGADGLRLLSASGKDEERESSPAENLLSDLLALPQKEKLSTLILIDEVLMFAREKVRFDPTWRGVLQYFFQCLTQAATKVDRCAIIASLLATDPKKSDDVGKQIINELYDVFRREREEGVQPVVKEDVAEVLRRRFFKTETIKDREAFRPHVVAALKGIADLDEQTRKDGKLAEGRFLHSFPFHPDLTDVFYTKWTNLDGFQRTRGILRTFAMALRDAEKWDEAPIVGPNIFLGAPGQSGITEATRELTSVATSEEYEGRRQEWSAILLGEIEKAQLIQMDCPGLKHREVEQAVFATFIHSQPIGHKALTRELVLLLGATRPDKIELEKALLKWGKVSWFLDEGLVAEGSAGELPKAWRLGSKPNLNQMHHDAKIRISPDLIEAKLLTEIGRLKSLTAGAAPAGARVHNLPERPRDIEDDGEFHYAVLGPKAVSESGKPSAEAKRFIDEKTGPESPRVYRNAVVLAVPSKDGLEASRARIRDYLAWEAVRVQLKEQDVDPIRQETLIANLESAQGKIPDAIEQAYSIVVTVSDKDEIQAFKVAVGDNLFQVIKSDARSNIRDAQISADALLPGGPYDLWKKGETSRRVKDLVGAFAQFSHLPKMLRRKEILDTLVQGAKEGFFVLRLTRPDRSVRTFWREAPDDNSLKEPSLEVVLPEAAELSEIPAALLAPSALPGLWVSAELTFKALCENFAGGRVVKIKKDGYDEPVTIPKAARDLVESAVKTAVRDGKLWLTSGPASLLGEEIPAGVLSDDAKLQAPPQPIAATALTRESLPDAWTDKTTTALGIATALSSKEGKTLPWGAVREAIDGAIRARVLETAADSGTWPCDYPGAAKIKLQAPAVTPPPPPPVRTPGNLVAEADLRPNQIQDLADQVSDIAKAAVGHDLKFHLRVELGGASRPPDDVVQKINKLLKDVSDDLKLG